MSASKCLLHLWSRNKNPPLGTELRYGGVRGPQSQPFTSNRRPRSHPPLTVTHVRSNALYRHHRLFMVLGWQANLPPSSSCLVASSRCTIVPSPTTDFGCSFTHNPNNVIVPYRFFALFMRQIANRKIWGGGSTIGCCLTSARANALNANDNTRFGRASESGRGERKKYISTSSESLHNNFYSMCSLIFGFKTKFVAPAPPSMDLELLVDPNETTYCICNQVSF